MTTLKIEDRKNTTKAEIKAMEDLKNSFDFSADLNIITSPDFDMRADIGGDHAYVWSDLGYWEIEEGELCLCGYVEQYGLPCTLDSDQACWTRIEKIDFAGAVAALENIIGKYNELCIKKDAEIEKFLEICKAVKSA